MDNILKAIYGKLSGSTLSTDVGGRVYLDEAPQGCQFPYIVFFVVTAVPDKTFTEHYTDTVIQFSIFSSSSSGVEISGIYNDLKALYDDCTFTITSNHLVWMREQNLTTMINEVTTVDGLQTVKHWAVDFELKTSLD